VKPWIPAALPQFVFAAKTRAFMRVWLAVAFAALVAGLGVRAETALSESGEKVAFLLKFATFTDWPHEVAAPSPRHRAEMPPFKIGFLGGEELRKAADESVKTSQIKGRPVAFLNLQDASDVANCRVVFIAAPEAAQVDDVLQALKGKPVLTVSDVPGFAGHGGMVGFIKEDGKLRFEVNVEAAEKAGLKLSAKLLQCSKVVVAGPQGE
jgi:hypothetical protein